MQLSKVLVDRQAEIIQRWVVKMQNDDAVTSDRELSCKATLDSLPDMINAIAHILAAPRLEDAQTLLEKGLGHGEERAKQGYDAEEIVWEYAILRQVILDIIAQANAADADPCEPATLFKLISTVNSAIDKVVAFSMKRYADERMSELNRLYGELIASNQELDRIVRNEQTNLAHLAHELKSPLSSIIGYSDLFLKRYEKEGSVYTAYVDHALAGGRRLLETINNALEMSSYRAGKVSLAKQTVNACELVSEVSTALRIMAQQKGLTLLVECDSHDTELSTDKARLRQVVTNLVSNAIRYTDTGTIHVRTRFAKGIAGESVKEATEQSLKFASDQNLLAKRGQHSEEESGGVSFASDRIEIEVQDTGYGIDASEQGLIFGPYYQGKAGQQLQSSTGLGLAITHQIVRLLQGSIRLKSARGEGSTFTILLPLKMQPASDTSPSKSESSKPTASEVPLLNQTALRSTSLRPTIINHRESERITVDRRSASA